MDKKYSNLVALIVLTLSLSAVSYFIFNFFLLSQKTNFYKNIAAVSFPFNKQTSIKTTFPVIASSDAGLSDAKLIVGGTLTVKELCFPDGKCINSANELKPFSCKKVKYEASGPITPEQVCQQRAGNYKYCSLGKAGGSLPICSKIDYSFSGKLSTCEEICPQSFTDFDSYIMEMSCCQVKQILYNGDAKDKLDMAIIGEGYSDEKFIDLVNYIYSDSGLFGTEPYKSLKSRFNVWAVNSGFADIPDRNGKCEWGEYPDIEVYKDFLDKNLKSNGLIFADRQILFSSSKSMWPHASVNEQIIPTGCIENNVLAKIGALFGEIFKIISSNDLNKLVIKLIVIHETGHNFRLDDEYVYNSDYGVQSIRTRNCAPDKTTASNRWGSFRGQGQDPLEIGYYEGCTIPNAIRSVRAGFMKDQGITAIISAMLDFNEEKTKIIKERGYGEYNIKLIADEIKQIAK